MSGDRNTAPTGRLHLSTRRLEAFTDGVFAIAATLLVLDLTVRELGSIATDRQMWDGLLSLWPTVLNVAISFLLLGLLWSIHMRQFEYIERVNGTLIWLNIVRLLGVVLVPFTTRLNNEYSEFLAGRILLPVNFLAIVVLGAWQWFYATAPRHGLTANLTPTAIHNTRTHALTAVVLACAVVPLSAWVGSLAFLLFALDPVASVVLRRLGVLREETPRGGPGRRHDEGGPAEAEPPYST